MRRVLVILVLAGAVAACGEGTGGPGATVETQPTGGTAVDTTPDADPPETIDSTPASRPDLERMAEAAIADLSERLSVDPGAIDTVRSERVTWRDGSLGCPEPGKMYTQALVDGFLVVLEHEGKRYSYHAGSDASPFLCEKPSPPMGADTR